MRDIVFPWAIDGAGRTARAGRAAHVSDMIEQVLFTSPGERVNRPEFGTGLRESIFGPSSPETAAAIEFSARAALERYLGDVIQVQAFSTDADGSTLRVIVQYLLRETQEQLTADLTREL